ncbi:hypothetical protein ACH419_38900 [Streptomyces bobili]|uniref:hypothetical protein n=1 Tax=Streptomyces bobili TaxID=67280 RepID=UPI0037B1E72B
MTGGSLTAARTCPRGRRATVRTTLERAGATEAKNAAAFSPAVLAKLQELKSAQREKNVRPQNTADGR